MNPLYNIGIRLYAGGARVASLRSGKVKTMLAGQRQARSDIRSRLRFDERPVWIHAASLGEFEQARPLIEKLRREQPHRRILLTFFSPSGYEVRKDYPMVDAVSYLPFDTPANARRFISEVNPEMAVFVKYEFWGNYLQQLKTKGIPTYIISSIFRPGQSFFKPWGGMMRGMLRCFTRLYVQDEVSVRLLNGIGVTNVVRAGDTRFDRVTDVMRSTFSLPAVEHFLSSSPLKLIVGSSWEPDEDRYVPFLNAHPEIKAVIAPHEMHGDRLHKLKERFVNGAVLLSELSDDENKIPDAQVIVVDSFGKLSSLYRYADIAYVGGGFGTGIHNINEAAVYSAPVVFGPRFDKFKEAKDLIALGGAFTYNTPEELVSILEKFMRDPKALAEAGKAAGKYISDNLGATDIIFNDLFLPQNNKNQPK